MPQLGLVGALLVWLLLGAPAALAAGSAPIWEEIFADDGRSGAVTAKWRLWGGSEARRISRGPPGMRVTGGPDARDDTQRIMLWARVDLPPTDLRVEYDYTRHDSESPGLGISSMLFLACEGVPPDLPRDPAATRVAAPDYEFINTAIDGLRATYATDYNRNPLVREQLRLHAVPGNLDAGADSARRFPFTPGTTYRLVWEKLGDRLSVSVTPEGGPTLTHVWQDPVIATKRGRRLGLYQQPYRDSTYADLRVFRRVD